MKKWALTIALLVPIALGPIVAGATPEPGEEVHDAHGDPWQSFNRRVFAFNEGLDKWALKPVAVGWDFIMPDRAQTCFRNFFDNLRFPIVLLNDTLQWKPKAAGTDVARFLVNTTVGVAGFFDPATGWGLEESDEDFGQTLGTWGVGPGPYLVLPILGASSVRDGFGLIADTAASVRPWFIDTLISVGVTTFDTVNRRSLLIEEVDDARAASLDFYSAVRNAYQQRRRLQIRDEHEGAVEDEDDLYFHEDLDAL